MRGPLLCAVVLCAACGGVRTSVGELTLLTRGECVNTAPFAANLESVLGAWRLPNDYQVVDLNTLPATDPRTGYPTPTLLYRNRDLFGMPEPTPPFPAPT